MDIDFFLRNLPMVGVFFERSYDFWRAHVAVANITHVVLGAGIVLILLPERRKLGIILTLAAVLMHIIAVIW